MIKGATKKLGGVFLTLRFLNSIINNNTYISNGPCVNHTQHLKSFSFRGLLQKVKWAQMELWASKVVPLADTSFC